MRSKLTWLIRRLALHLIALSILQVGHTAHAFSGTEGASFLDLPVGARSAAMGSAYTALASDAYAPTANPAGLGFLESSQLSAMHVPYLEDTSFEYLSAVLPTGAGRGLGASVQYFYPGTVNGIDLNGTDIGDVGGYYAAYSLAYGQQVTDKVSLGATGKLIHAKIDSVGASAFAADFGTMVRLTPRIRLAAVVDNVGQKLNFLQRGDSLPTSVRLGAAAKIFKSLTVTAEGVYRNYGLSSIQAGWEWANAQGFSIRGGYDTEHLRQLNGFAGLSLGLGVNLWGHELAYAWIPLGDLGTTHYLALVLRFGKPQQAENDDNFQQHHEYSEESLFMDELKKDESNEDLNQTLGK